MMHLELETTDVELNCLLGFMVQLFMIVQHKATTALLPQRKYDFRRQQIPDIFVLSDILTILRSKQQPRKTECSLL